MSRRADRTLVQNWHPHAVTWGGLELGPVSSVVLGGDWTPTDGKGAKGE